MLLELAALSVNLLTERQILKAECAQGVCVQLYLLTCRIYSQFGMGWDGTTAHASEKSVASQFKVIVH